MARQARTVMFLHDTPGMFDCNQTLEVQSSLKSGTTDLRLLVDCKASISKTSFDINRAVFMPYLGLSALKTLHYRAIATRVHREDGQPMDQALMNLVWRGLIFNLFYFESEELKQTKLAEEDWESVQMSADGNSSSPKRVRDESDESAPKRVIRLVDSMRV